MDLGGICFFLGQFVIGEESLDKNWVEPEEPITTTEHAVATPASVKQPADQTPVADAGVSTEVNLLEAEVSPSKRDFFSGIYIF